MAQREKELCIGRKKFNMDPMKVGNAGARVGGSRELHAGHRHSVSFFPSTDTITSFPEEETEAPRAQHLVQCPTPSGLGAPPPHSQVAPGPEVGARRMMGALDVFELGVP